AGDADDRGQVDLAGGVGRAERAPAGVDDRRPAPVVAAEADGRGDLREHVGGLVDQVLDIRVELEVHHRSFITGLTGITGIAWIAGRSPGGGAAGPRRAPRTCWDRSTGGRAPPRSPAGGGRCETAPIVIPYSPDL